MSFASWWWASIKRTVPESERITKLSVVAPPAWKRAQGVGSEGVNALKQVGKDPQKQAQALKGKLAARLSLRAR